MGKQSIEFFSPSDTCRKDICVRKMEIERATHGPTTGYLMIIDCWGRPTPACRRIHFTLSVENMIEIRNKINVMLDDQARRMKRALGGTGVKRY